jgi:Zn-dependent peptidase ImmA (M78 family)
VPVRVEVKPELLAWARERSGLGAEELARRFPQLAEWEQGDLSPTLKQLEGFAQATHTPVGFLFLVEPPEDRVPIADYRTMGGSGVRRPSPDLLDTIYQCERRQEWYREFALLNRADPVGLVGSLATTVPVVDAASTVRAALAFEVHERASTWADALRTLIEHAEDLGVLVMVSGVVGSNTHRKLDPEEFRGFALVDRLAPLVFLNGADTKAAQIFTLVHELGHLWLGETALDNAELTSVPTADAERWCNQVAAEVLLPLAYVSGEPGHGEPLADRLEQLARRFKVSTLVALRRIYDAGQLGWDDYRAAYQSELQRVSGILGERAAGGNFFKTQPARVSRRFARAVIASTFEGETLYRDALDMLGFKKVSTFQELAQRLGVA